MADPHEKKEIEFIAVRKSKQLSELKFKAGVSEAQGLVSRAELMQFITDKYIRKGFPPPDLSKTPVKDLIIENNYPSSGEWSIFVIEGPLPPLPKIPGFRGVFQLTKLPR